MRSNYLFAKAISIGFAAAFFLFATIVQGQQNKPTIDPDIAEMLSTNPPPPGFATRLDYIKSFTSQIEIEKAYRSNKITKEEAMVAMTINKLSPADNSNMDTYGKVVDQHGEPVSNAKVQAYLGFEERGVKEEHSTMTDVQGRFQFLGLHAKGLAMVPEKAGYEFNSDLSPNVNRPSNYIPDPNHPLVLTMYKLRGGNR